MKIAFVIDAFFPVIGGGQVHVAEISKVLSKRYSCKVEVITSRLGAGNKNFVFTGNKNLKITRLGPSWSFENWVGRIIFLLLATLKLLSEKYDLISAQAFLPAIPAKIANFFKKTPIILTIHGVSLTSREEMSGRVGSKFYRFIEEVILFKLRYDYQITVSSDFLKYPNINKNIAIIGNGVDLSPFERVEVKKARLFKILFVGRLHPQKGLFYLADAVKIINQKYPQVQVVIVGEGPQEVKLKKYLAKAGLSSKFIFKGKLTGKSLISEYKSSHLFVLPSVYEGFPLTLLEAWAAKLPVVVTAVGEISKLVKNRVNGVVVKPANSQKLSEAIVSVIENKERENLGLQGYKVAKQFSWGKIAQKTYQVFEKVAANA